MKGDYRTSLILVVSLMKKKLRLPMWCSMRAPGTKGIEVTLIPKLPYTFTHFENPADLHPEPDNDNLGYFI
jgi:hypothetical protein